MSDTTGETTDRWGRPREGNDEERASRRTASADRSMTSREFARVYRTGRTRTFPRFLSPCIIFSSGTHGRV